MAETEKTADITALTVELLSAYLANNTFPSEGLAELIRTTRIALTEDTKVEVVEEEQTFTPAVSVRKSLASPQHILSLIDGKPYKTLKRHLAANGLTPDAYRERYNLLPSYPMVAADFAATRREIAQRIGLGNRAKAAPAVQATATADAASEAKPAAAKTTKAAKPASTDPVAAKPASRPSKAKSKSAASGSDSSDSTITGEVVAKATPSKAKAAPRAKAKPKSNPATSPVKGGANSAGATEAKTKAGAASAATATPQAESVNAAATKPAPKSRGKLGLFGKKTSERAAPETTAAVSDPTPTLKPTKAPKPKRMARTPKAAAPKAD